MPTKDNDGNVIGALNRQLWSKDDITRLCGGREILTIREEI
jgi:hypothetical protein